MNLLRISQYIQRFIHVHIFALVGLENQRKMKVLKELFQLSADFLNEVGEEYWLDFGTLLGYHREHGILPHDIDVDFGMHEKSYEKVLSKRNLLSPKVKFYDSSHRHHGPKLYFNYKGFDVDIYFYEDLGDEVRSYEETKWPNERQKISKELVYPLKSAEMLGKKVSTPSQIKRYLEKVYGYIGSVAKRNQETGFWEKD